MLPVILVLGLLTGCDTAAQPAAHSPGAATLVAKSAQNLDTLQRVEFTFTLTGTIPGFPVRSASGVADAGGWARGTVDLQQGLDHTEYNFTLTDDSVYLTAGAGAPTERESPESYTPERLLSADTGIGALLHAATALHTETTETLHGVETYRVTGKLDRTTLATVIPNVWADAVVKFWVTQAPSHSLRRVWVQLPPRKPNLGVVSVQLALSTTRTGAAPTSS